jgi:hypothetical protein
VKDLAELISALASLAWPVVALAIVLWFKPEIRAVLARLRRGKVLGTEFELDELQAKTEIAEAKIPIVAALPREGRLDATATVVPAAQVEIEEVLREAARLPRLGLMLLSAKIEKAAREMADEAVLDVQGRSLSPASLLNSLLQSGKLPVEAADALHLFYQVRNRIVHGHEADNDEIARAIDSGTRLLRLLLSRPRPETQTQDG